ncbi:MAG: glycosyltransferase, partial [Hyphomicrobiales bacterium]
VGLSEVTGISPDKIDVIWNGIDTERIMQAAQDPLPEPFTGTIGPRTILFAGRLTKQKGPDLLLEACGQLAHSGTMIDLVLVGQGKMYKALKTRAAELGLSQHVRFAGYQPNPFPFFSQAGVFVLPSRYEGFGLVVAEALACQIKIIASDCRSGPREILDNGAYGKLVKTGSVQALSEALDTALNHSEPQTDAACNAGLERARAFDMCVFQSDWAKYIAQFSRTYIPSG